MLGEQKYSVSRCAVEGDFEKKKRKACVLISPAQRGRNHRLMHLPVGSCGRSKRCAGALLPSVAFYPTRLSSLSGPIRALLARLRPGGQALELGTACGTWGSSTGSVWFYCPLYPQKRTGEQRATNRGTRDTLTCYHRPEAMTQQRHAAWFNGLHSLGLGLFVYIQFF